MDRIILDEIRELSIIIKKSNVNDLEIFTSNDFNKNGNLMTKLFHILCQSEISNLTELKYLIYQGKNKAQFTFNRLFYRFREKLFNTLFFINTNSSLFTDRATAYYECTKRVFLSRMIAERGLKYLSLSISEAALKISLKYEFTELSLIISKFIINLIGALNYKIRLLNKYKNIYRAAKIMYLNELKFSEKCYEVISYTNSNHKLISNPLNNSNFDDLISDAWICLNENSSVELLQSCAFLILAYNKEKKRFNDFKNNTQLFIDKLLKKKFLSLVVLESLMNELLKVALITKDVKIAIKIEKSYFDYFNINSFNRFVLQFGYIHTLIHCKEYDKSLQCIQEAISNISFKKQPPVIKQNFYVLQAYAHFLYKIGKIRGVANAKDFRVNKFLNEVPEYSRDKQGVNIPIILVQILFFLSDEKHHLIIDRIDSLKLYAYRYLKKDENFRSQCFIRMLAEMVRAGFKRQGTVFRTKDLLDKLNSVPIDTYPATAENEIIPYEDLWEMVLDLLK